MISYSVSVKETLRPSYGIIPLFQAASGRPNPVWKVRKADSISLIGSAIQLSDRSMPNSRLNQAATRPDQP
jgi:hypothetical protein